MNKLVSVNADDLARVVNLAVLTEDRDNAEQRSLLAVAERLDVVRDRIAVAQAREAGRLKIVDGEVIGDNPAASSCELLADRSRVLDPESGQKPVKTSWERKRRERRTVAAW